MNKIANYFIRNYAFSIVQHCFDDDFVILLADETSDNEFADACHRYVFYCIFKDCNVLKFQCFVDGAAHGLPDTKVNSIETRFVPQIGNQQLKNAMQVFFQYLQNKNNNCYWLFEQDNELIRLFIEENLTKDHWKQQVSTRFPFYFREIDWEWSWRWQSCSDNEKNLHDDEDDKSKTTTHFTNYESCEDVNNFVDLAMWIINKMKDDDKKLPKCIERRKLMLHLGIATKPIKVVDFETHREFLNDGRMREFPIWDPTLNGDCEYSE